MKDLKHTITLIGMVIFFVCLVASAVLFKYNPANVQLADGIALTGLAIAVLALILYTGIWFLERRKNKNK